MEPKMQIPFYTREVYGNTNMYIADEQTAATIQTLTGTKTILPYHKKALEKLGFEFTQVFAPIKN